MTNDYRGRLIYNTSNNDFKMHVNGSATQSLTLNSTTLTTNNITGTGGTFNILSITGTSGKPTVPTGRGVFIGSESTSAAGIDICVDTWQYI